MRTTPIDLNVLKPIILSNRQIINIERQMIPDVMVQEAKALFSKSIVRSTSELYNWINSGIMRTKNIDLLEHVGWKPRTTIDASRRNV